MPKIRTFQRQVTLTSQGEYEEAGDKLLLKRWRVIPDNEPPRPWEWAKKHGLNGGWAESIPVAELKIEVSTKPTASEAAKKARKSKKRG